MYHAVYGTKVHRFKAVMSAVWNYLLLVKTRAKAVRQLILMFAVQMLVLKLGTWGNSIWNLEEVWTRDINDKGCADALKAGKSSKKETIVIEFIGFYEFSEGLDTTLLM